MALHKCETQSKGLQIVLGLSQPKSEYLKVAVLSDAHLTVRTSRVAIAQPTTSQDPGPQAGTTMQPDEAYFEAFPNVEKEIWVNHMLEAYMHLTEKLY